MTFSPISWWHPESSVHPNESDTASWNGQNPVFPSNLLTEDWYWEKVGRVLGKYWENVEKHQHSPKYTTKQIAPKIHTIWIHYTFVWPFYKACMVCVWGLYGKWVQSRYKLHTKLILVPLHLSPSWQKVEIQSEYKLFWHIK